MMTKAELGFARNSSCYSSFELSTGSSEKRKTYKNEL